jgi:hypothetical protein
MTLKKVERLRAEVADLRQKRDVKSREVAGLAKRIGRVPDKRGKEPTYVHPELSSRRPISIPNHPTLTPGTKNNILDDLDSDLDAYEEILTKEVTIGNGHLD